MRMQRRDNIMYMMKSIRYIHLLFHIPIFFILTSCTISFQNISTNGKADDLVDDNQAASPNVSLEIPLAKF